MSWPPRSSPGAIRRLYNTLLRPYLPYKISVHGGVAVRGVVRLLDSTDEFPGYEAPLLESLRENVRAGDDVVVVGGGLGVSTVVASRNAGRSGSVVTYEGGAERAELIGRTATLNRIPDNFEITHAIVGEGVSVHGDQSSAEVVAPADLPECDVLELDCEGAELEVLGNLETRPRTIIVETHGFLDSPEDRVRAELDRLGYRVVSRGVEEAELGVYILTAVRAS